MKRYISIVLILAILIPLFPILPSHAAPADLGAMVYNMPTGQNLFLTLYNNGDSDLRWNVSGVAEINSDLHLYGVNGDNCNFKLQLAESGWYGIKFLKNNGIDRYVDVGGKSTAEGKALHIWESDDGKLIGNNHRQFAFYKAGTDAQGNQLYYIKIRHSNMFVGIENNSVASERKLIQTAKNPRKWYVTPSIVPNKSGESLPWTQSTGLYFELFARNTMNSVSVKNREGNIETDGMGLNLYNLGQSSRWLLRYNSSYKAYEIASTKYETDKGLSLTGKVWDTASEDADTDLNVWSNQSKANNENTSQLWRFVANSDGSYYIYNARSGKFVCINGSDLTQGERSNAQAFVLSPLSTDTSSSYGNVFSGTREELRWMKSIPDTVLLSEINLPGTHDTGAMAVVQDMSGVLDNTSITKCQKHYFEEQLATGVRSFDIRCNADANSKTVNDVMIIHGNSLIQCYNRYGGKLSLGELLDIGKLFLSLQPSETLVFLIKPDDGTHEDLARTLKAYIQQNPNLFWQSDTVPTLRQARGKIVLLRRFQTNSANAMTAFGPDLTQWDNQDYGSVKGLIKLPGTTGSDVYIQDAYSQTGGAKKEFINGAIAHSASIPRNAYIYNYTSCTLGFVIDTTRDVNAWLYGQSLTGKRLGNIMMNYTDSVINQKIYHSNRFSQPALDRDITIHHSLNLASDISMNYMIPATQLSHYSSFYLSCTIPQYTGNTLTGSQTVNLTPTLKGNYYSFTLEGLTAVQIGDQITAELHMSRDGIQYYSPADKYSIADYAYSQLGKSEISEELKVLCAHLLLYGSSAQVFKGYRTDSLCHSKMTDIHRGYLTDLSTITFQNHNRVLNDLEAPIVTWAGKGLDLDTKIRLLFVFDPASYQGDPTSLQLRLSYEDIRGTTQTAVLRDPELYYSQQGYYAFSFSGLLASELRQVVTAAIYDGEQQISSALQYSIDTYGNGKTGPLEALCRAMIAYSDAAKNYFLSI